MNSKSYSMQKNLESWAWQEFETSLVQGMKNQKERNKNGQEHFIENSEKSKTFKNFNTNPISFKGRYKKEF